MLIYTVKFFRYYERGTERFWFFLQRFAVGLQLELLMKTRRLCVFPKDVQCITGKSERYGRRLLADIRVFFKKEPHQFITVYEFATYCGLDVEDLFAYLE